MKKKKEFDHFFVNFWEMSLECLNNTLKLHLHGAIFGTSPGLQIVL